MSLELFEQSWTDVWEGAEPVDPVGAIFTKPEVTAFILDLAGYRVGAGRLAERRLLEPSCGDGAFLAEAIRRLLESERLATGAIDWQSAELRNALTACDLNSGYVATARDSAVQLLLAEGCPAVVAGELAASWILHADFLLTHWPQRFDFVVGNPPYVRIEDLPPRVLARYRELFATCADRADLYVAFFEQGLRLLTPDGCLAFICANRFAKNLYGRSLRQLVSSQHHVRYYLNLEHTQPFVSDVSAYPCIAVIDQRRGEPTHAATLDDVSPESLASIQREMAGAALKHLHRFPRWYEGEAPWVSTDHTRFVQLSRLAERCALLEESAAETKIGIGVATGADEVYVLPALDPEIEAVCQLPMIMAADIAPAKLTWSGHYLLNPFAAEDDGSLVDLERHPGMRRYLERHSKALLRRHVAQKRPQNWYRTIDRVNAQLTAKPKLVIPDIQAGGVVGVDAGSYYPHHNVYWITSTGWELSVLQALLRSRAVREQIEAFSVQMRGGSLRYQAQVLRKVRVPLASSLPLDLRMELAVNAGSADEKILDRLADAAFGMMP